MNTAPLGPSHVGGLRDLRPLPSRRWLRRLLPWLIAAAALLLAGAGWLLWDDAPESLSESRLTGPRSPVPLSFVILLDESGSFNQYAAIRKTVLEDLAAWAPENLRPDDVVTVIGFAGDSVVRRPPVTVAELAATGAQYDLTTNDSGRTAILPALREADALLPRTMPATLVIVTDTVVPDAAPGEVRELTRDIGATTTTTVLPKGQGMEDIWADAFPWGVVVTADPGSADQTGLALARAVAHATGQSVERDNSR